MGNGRDFEFDDLLWYILLVLMIVALPVFIINALTDTNEKKERKRKQKQEEREREIFQRGFSAGMSQQQTITTDK